MVIMITDPTDSELRTVIIDIIITSSEFKK